MKPRQTLQHAAMEQFPTDNNCLVIGGVDLPKLRLRAAQTPFYAYDRQLITERVASLRHYLPEKIQLHYAIKANPMPALVQHLAGLTDGLDVASLGELRIALDTGIKACDISFTGPGKNDTELLAALAAGVIINVESTGELQRLIDLAQQHQCRAKLSLRVNPGFELKTSGMKMSGGPKPFGIDAEQLPEILQSLDTSQLDFYGLHIFCGSQNLQPEAIIEAHNNTFALARELSQRGQQALRWLNIGGGFGVPYFPGDQHLPLRPIADNLERLLKEYREDFANTQLVLELGRYLVAEAGVYVCEVIDKKVSRGETFVVCNGGLHQHLALSGNFGQVIRKNYPVCVGNRLTSESMEVVNIVGPLCTPLDILGQHMNLPTTEIGDLIVVYQSGAYGRSASPAAFLGHPVALELLI